MTVEQLRKLLEPRNDLELDLERLKGYHDQGLITDDEYAQEKAQALSARRRKRNALVELPYRATAHAAGG